MGLFNKKTTIYSPAKGFVKSIERVNDQMFAAKALGDGFAVEPAAELIVSPIEGTVVFVFPTKHAISLKNKQGLEVLLHIGIDTVELGGAGFTIKVSEGDQVTEETALAEVDFSLLASKGKETDVMVIFTNLEKKTVVFDEGQVVAGQAIGTIK
ncbi:PTS sugar transporter subunit IIA [Enterococcus sp. AZ072]|uniref:PTS sugar transporter subunit IIA n=1 Tax=unclassified Enterococcus TaxID=2608891 RepID=UPI003D2D4641